jgi:hypothetical protein
MINWKGFERKCCHRLRFYAGICLEELRKTLKHVRRVGNDYSLVRKSTV